MLCKNVNDGQEVAVKIISISVVQKFDKVVHVFRERDLLYEL